MRKAIFLLLSTLASITADAQMQYAEHSLLAQGKWVKIRVDNSGVYQLSKNDLKKMGFSDPAKVKLYGYNLPVLPDDDIDGMDDDLTEIPLYRDTPSGNLLFYSKGTTLWTKSGKKFYHLNNPYSSYIYYFLTEDTSGAPATFNTHDAESNATITQKTTYTHSIYDKDEYSFGNFGRRFYESTEYSSGSAKAYSINVNKHTTSDIYVDVLFGANSSSASTVAIKANGKLATLQVQKLGENAVAQKETKSFTVTSLATDKLPVSLSMTSGTKGHLDYIRASYERELDMTGENYIEFSPNEKGTSVFEISGANENAIVWDVTSISSMCALKGTYSNGTYKVLSEDMLVSDTYVVLDKNATYPVPTKVGTVENQDLHSMKSVDLLVIVPTSGKLTAQAERLAAFHKTHDSIDYAIVSADKIYNEFSSGTPDVTAYRRFIKMLYEKGEAGQGRKLKNVLLFGASVWDNKLMLLGTKKYSADDYLLCYESDDSETTTSSYVLEEYIVCPNDGYSILQNKPLIGLGRIPVTTADEAKGVVDKTIAYILNTNAGNWRNSICVLADDGTTKEGAYTHMSHADAMTNTLESSYPNFRFSRIYWDAYPWEQSATGTRYPGVESDINKTVLDGALIMNYTGHGAPLTLSHEMAVKIDDFKNWNTSRPPVWITAACETTPFDMNTDNLGEAAVLNKDGGAIAFFGTTRAVYGVENASLNKLLMNYLLTNKGGKRYSLGEALSQTKSDLISQGDNTLNKAQFVLLGDPAIVLPNPDYNIVIDSINGKSVNEGICKISAGEKVTVRGHVVDGDNNELKDFEGIVESSVFDNRETITTNNNNDSEDKEFTFSDYKRRLYNAADSIKNGVFTFTFPVPLDNNYSNEAGLINLYATNKSHTVEAFGSFRNFAIGGTNMDMDIDTIGPNIATYINSDHTIDGQKVNETPTIYVHLSDSSGINASGNGLGHDIVAIIDGKEATTYNLNNYYRQTTGDYTSGKIEFTFPALEGGKHTLTVRAFDTLNNMSEKHYSFIVYEGLTKVVEYYDFAGRLVSDVETSSLPKGVYIRKIKYMSNDEEIQHETKKVIM
ncbi:MAG: type IX secretion system sortase PorU [Bacteroidaceae bacterium]|nr:type IX secretion system sortase PorU [Bacteroidaceae bacterium]